MLFGDPQIFALNCIDNKQRKIMVNLQVIINGNETGTLEDATYIPTFKASLNRLANPETLDSKEASLTIREKYDYFLDPETSGKYMASLGDSFDDFDIFFYEDESDYINFIWGLHDKKVFSYPNLKNDFIYSGKVSKLYFINLVNEFLEWVNEGS